MWRCTAMPTWFGRSPGHAAYNSRRVLPVARARTRSPKLGVRAPASRPPDLLVAALGGRPRPCLASNVFPSTAAADLGLLAEGVVLTRVSAAKAMRHVYRQEFRQPLLVALFLFQVGSGVYLATHSDVRPINRFRTFQIASGIFWRRICSDT